MPNSTSSSAETLAWSALKDSQHAPAGVADLTLTAAGEHGVVAFGGLGAKGASAHLALLQPGPGSWGPLQTTGVGRHHLDKKLPHLVNIHCKGTL
jgi:hypothetical protein